MRLDNKIMLIGWKNWQGPSHENNRQAVPPGIRIDCKSLHQINPEAAWQAMLKYLKTNSENRADAAKAFGINLCIAYDILDKAADGNLRNRDKRRSINQLGPRQKSKCK